MYPLFDKVVEPALVAAGARRVIEIGALRGDTTARLLDLLGPESEIHVIDPVPMFDPGEHAKRFGGRYVFHRDISHNVLAGLPPCDAALIDGDHNWFTVHGELERLRQVADRTGSPLPLLILHDVGWPYGRRDLYYEPDRIPEEFRQPYDRRGIVPGRSALADSGGLNPQLANAVSEGGERNGVLTALDDFAAEHGALRRVVLPIYYGLALAADDRLLAARPALGELFDRFESAEGRAELLELSESIRVREQVHHHNLHFATERRAERASGLYLDLLKDALLDEHYLENELRIKHLLKCIDESKSASPHKLGDPARYMATELTDLRRARRSGRLDAAGDGAPRAGRLALAEIGRVRLDHLHRTLDQLRAEAVAGDLLDCGPGAGGSAILMRGYLEAHELGRPRVWVAGRLGARAESPGNGSGGFPPSLNTVREAFDRFRLLDDRVTFIQGAPAERLSEAPIERLALARVHEPDPDQLGAVLESVYDRLAAGGSVIVDGCADPACRDAVDRFRSERGIAEPLERVDWSAVSWRRTAESEAVAAAAPEPDATGAKDLSVVVVFHDMRREAARTLHSLSRAYQQGIEDLDYEVIVVENGSAPDQRLGGNFVRGFGPEFAYLDLGDSATSSPAPAVNRGIEAASGRVLALMIDGAHVLTPGVLRLGMLGLASYAPAVVATQQWYVGPGQQNEMVAKGYGGRIEDRLFEQIDWPADGYKLFDIGHFIGDRDWFDGQWESNCVFIPRPLLDQTGAMDEDFAMPGGGFVNLDLFERVASSPGVTLVSILGEGSFHQIHGGTTTNVGAVGERSGLITSYGEHYDALRGRPYHSPAKQINYVGSLPPPARRTRARRMGAPAFFKAAHDEGLDARPAEAFAVPQELRDEFIDAFWRSKEWHRTTWLGKWVNKAPTDLLAYQDLIFRVRPDWVVETGTGGGGRALFCASICELIGHGRVLSIGDDEVPTLAEHDRITYLRRDPNDHAAELEVRELLGDRPRALLILAAAGRDRQLEVFERYAPLVPVGSYVVLEDTIVNGHPVWPGFGPGPSEAARELLRAGEFEPDPELERYALTFNPGGFLRRVAFADQPAEAPR